MRPTHLPLNGLPAHLVFAFTCCGLAVGCASHPATAPAANAAGKPVASRAVESPVIVRLVSRHYSVVISAGRPSPVYTIRDAAGSLLARNLTLDQLRDTRVDLYDQLAPLICPENSASARNALWAGE